VKSLWEADAAAIERERDPMIEWARELVVAIEALEERNLAQDGEWLEIGPRYFAMLEQSRGGPLYPDANGTLRFSYAKVRGYSPRDGVQAMPQTTVGGLVAKHTGVAPFVVPEALRTAAAHASESRFADPKLGDVPVAFLSDADTTGGNSGSPVVDGRGRWIGLNFDRVWENVAGDFGYSTERSRNIVVDVRYLLWVLEVAHADALLAELGADAVARAPVSTGASTPAAATAPTGEVGVPIDDAPPKHAAVSASCACASTGTQSPLACMVVLLALLHRRRRGP
jgi:MYXO-CTERM domain-containing protein